MIPATHWADGEDGTAWWVWDPALGKVDWGQLCDNPNCRGGEVQYPEWEGHTERCPDCDGTGRHTFDVEVEYPSGGWWVRKTHRVSVVPNHVVPIVPCDSPCNDTQHIVIDPNGGAYYHDGLICGHRIDRFPSSARVGMFAVKVRVAK